MLLNTLIYEIKGKLKHPTIFSAFCKFSSEFRSSSVSVFLLFLKQAECVFLLFPKQASFMSVSFFLLYPKQAY